MKHPQGRYQDLPQPCYRCDGNTYYDTELERILCYSCGTKVELEPVGECICGNPRYFDHEAGVMLPCLCEHDGLMEMFEPGEDPDVMHQERRR